ncbi:MAG TPA: GGDEF domain-containing protein, partial [Verrucomicrobiae bacterium]|nr:GGDEF domain-containing protein [Verrucomicrobiae bacterium]
INDLLGHDAGDAALRRLSASLRRQLRPDDVAGRLGGDEFAVLLPGATAAVAAQWCEGLRAAMEGLGFEAGGLPQPVSISVGHATWDPGMRNSHEFMRLADQALLRAKAAGRNCVREAIMGE